MADPDIKIVVNLTIPAVHYAINKQILEAGKNAYCEKPLALSAEEALDLTATAKRKIFLLAALQIPSWAPESRRFGS